MTGVAAGGRLEPLPLAGWEESRLYLQLVCQIVGKARMALHPRLNHWWHVTLYVSPRGLTTGPIPSSHGHLQIDVDLLGDAVLVSTDRGERREIALAARPLASFFAEFVAALTEVGAACTITPEPYDCKSTIPYPEDTEHATYDAEAVRRAWRALRAIDAVLWEFRGRFVGKCSPVQVFWHSFDLACARFSGRVAPAPPPDRVSRESYSHELISAGFWFGDDNVPEAAFYCYAWPSPEGLDSITLRPEAAFWVEAAGAPQARMLYEEWRSLPDPRAGLLDFLQSSYEAAAGLGGWDRAALEASPSA
jgi:hypothetical protein